jgi:short chain dehydrogenase
MGLLEGKVAVITGAGSGMAKASTTVFVREGAKVVAADISGGEKDTATEVGDSVLPVHCDVTKEADAVRIAGRSGERHLSGLHPDRDNGRLDCAARPRHVRKGRPGPSRATPRGGRGGGFPGVGPSFVRHWRHHPCRRRLVGQALLTVTGEDRMTGYESVDCR